MKTKLPQDRERARRFRALVQGEFRPEFNRAVAIAVRRALRAQRDKQGAMQPAAPGQAAPPSDLRQNIQQALTRAQANIWRAQEEQARRRYPDLSLERELQNPQFVRFLTDSSQPMSVCQAYEAVHLDEIRSQIAREAAIQTACQLAALARRPREGGAAPQAGLPVHWGATDPRRRAEIARRALRGERVTL